MCVGSAIRTCALLAAAAFAAAPAAAQTPTMSTAVEGSYFVLPRLEVRRNAQNQVMEDTIVTIANGGDVPVLVWFLFTKGDPTTPPQPHASYDNHRVVAAHGSTSFAVSTGSGVIVPLDILGAIPDPDHPGQTVVRAFMQGWASDPYGNPIRHDHIVARATIVEYGELSALAYSAFHAPVVDPAIAEGAPTTEGGVVRLDGLTYAAPPAQLHLNFAAVGSDAYTGPASSPITTDTELTVMPARIGVVDPDQLDVAPRDFGLSITTYNENEVKFTAAPRCRETWDSRFLGDYDLPNYFVHAVLQTDFGHALLDATAGSPCLDEPVPLLGIAAVRLDFGAGSIAGAGFELIGSGAEPTIVELPADTAPAPMPAAPPERAAAAIDPAAPRLDPSAVGSLFIVPDVDLRWSSTDLSLLQDVWVHLTNTSTTGGVRVVLLFMQGDGVRPEEGGEPAHPGFAQRRCEIALTQNQPLVWSLAGGATGIPSWRELETLNGVPGRPADDDTGERTVRGMLVGWAVDELSRPISWNHLACDVRTIDHLEHDAWATTAWHARAIADAPGTVLGEKDVLRFDGLMYPQAPERAGGAILARGASIGGAQPTDCAGIRYALGSPQRTVAPPGIRIVPETTSLRPDIRDDAGWANVLPPGFAWCMPGWQDGIAGLPPLDLELDLSALGTRSGSAWIRGTDAGCPDAATMSILGAQRERINLTGILTIDRTATNLVGRGGIDAIIEPAPDIGSCCRPDGSCVATGTVHECIAMGGIFTFEPCGTADCPDPDAVGACCLFTFPCAELTVAQCAASGGAFQGVGTTCASTSCTAGACCLPDGTCLTIRGVAACTLQHGASFSTGYPCEPTTCAVGACCLDDGECFETANPAYCDIEGGTWLGWYTTCDAWCPTPCDEDLDLSFEVGFGDLLIVLSSWGPCSPFGGCPADLDGSFAVDFADLLRVLAAWGPCD